MSVKVPTRRSDGPLPRVALLSPVELVNELLGDALIATGRVEVAARATSHQDMLSAGVDPSNFTLVYDGSTSASVRELSAIMTRMGTSRAVVYGLFESPADPAYCAAAGAHGLLARDAKLGDLVRAIEAADVNGSFISPSVAQTLEADRQARRVIEQLTTREKEVAGLIAQGLSNKQIAAALRATEGTVKIHVHNILAKLHLADREAIAALAARWLLAEKRAPIKLVRPEDT